MAQTRSSVTWVLLACVVQFPSGRSRTQIPSGKANQRFRDGIGASSHPNLLVIVCDELTTRTLDRVQSGWAFPLQLQSGFRRFGKTSFGRILMARRYVVRFGTLRTVAEFGTRGGTERGLSDEEDRKSVV